ncbi:ABC transporter substrate-binding protein [Streptomyces sp. NPDC126514]|uniref:ABC transporter substrate-binding protein n=1 Tax=Streptomyces sp. NPDC126514 TaxID=3155210 RepID=UPI00332A6331
MPQASTSISQSRRDVLRVLCASAAGAWVSPALVGCTDNTTPDPQRSSAPRRGGTLRAGVAGGSAKDTVDAHRPLTHPDQARVIQLYDTLTGYDTDFRVQSALAESVESSADARQWTIRLRPGLEFHNGKPVTSEDVAFTIRRIVEPSDPKSGATSLSAVDTKAIKILDKRTIRLDLKTPESELESVFANYALGVVPVGYDARNPVGTGPFKFSSFTPGRESTFTRNDNYWRTGEPYLDKVVIVDFPEDTARVNALQSGQVDAIDQVSVGQLSAIQGNADLRLLESETGSWIPFVMRVDKPPFNDDRVREAFRLIVDREEMVRQVLGGHGAIGNDLYGRFDPAYDTSIPQRRQDIEQAKRLLQQSGHENLEVELVTSPVASGLVESAQVFAAQARRAGVSVRIRKVDSAEFFGPNYLKWTFTQDFWYTRGYLGQANLCSIPEAPFNETHWSDPQFTQLVLEARSTIDDKRRTELIREAQRIEHERGGYIVWSFPNQIDAYTRRISGFKPDRSGLPLTSYGFRQIWFNS